LVAEGSAEQVARRHAEDQGERQAAEDERDGSATVFRWGQDGGDEGRGGCVDGRAQGADDAGDQEQRVVRGEGGEEVAQGGDAEGDDEERAAFPSAGDGGEEGRRDRVGDGERGQQLPRGGVRDVQFLAHGRQHAGDDVPARADGERAGGEQVGACRHVHSPGRVVFRRGSYYGVHQSSMDLVVWAL
jgi:hypothetical protein